MIKLDDYFDAYARDYAYYKGGAVCYEDGCLYRGLITLFEASGENRWLDHLKRLANGQVTEAGELANYSPAEYNIDNVLSGRAFLYLYKKTGEARYLKGAEQLIDQLRSHPRIKAGPYWHKLRYPHQVWLDGLYMALPFKAEFGCESGPSELAVEAAEEMVTALKLTQDPPSGLYRHGYDESREQSWADQETGLSPAHWGRSIGWLAMALVDLLEPLSETPSSQALTERLASLLKKLGALQGPDGRWLQVIDQPELEGNYPESSATAMIAYACLKAFRLGLAGSDVKATGERALAGLADHAFTVNADGRTVLGQICCVAGLGGFDGKYRDGSPQYYLSESLRDDDIKGVGPLMMAYSEMLRIS